MAGDMHLEGSSSARKPAGHQTEAATAGKAAAPELGGAGQTIGGQALLDDFKELRDELCGHRAFGPNATVESIATWGEGTLEGVVADMEDPDKSLPPNYFEENVLTWFTRYHLLPLIETRKPGEGPIVIGLRACEPGSQAPRHPTEIQERMLEFSEYVLPRLSCLQGKEHRIVYLLLNNRDFEDLQEYGRSPAKRKEYLNKIDPEVSATIAYYSLLRKAILLRASDIHIEPFDEKCYRVRYRIDGVLQPEEFALPRARGLHLVGKIKVEAQLKIQEKRLPQDGSVAFSTAIFGEFPFLEGYSLRIASNPTPLGEKVTIRLLKAASQEGFDLNKLGLPPDVHSKIVAQIASASGVILVSGPTGSGKTTTLYSVLRRLNAPGVNIQTIEDPIEVLIPGLNQSQVHRDIDYDFARALRSFLRMDPDVILVGEVRDAETAKVMIEAANTGHLVLSTIHTNDSISVLPRLFELGVERTQIQNSLRAVISQRLVRTLCSNVECIEPYDARAELNKLFGRELFAPPAESPEGNSAEQLLAHDAVIFFHPAAKSKFRNCKLCRGTGYYGRTIVPEIWVIGREEQDMIFKADYSHASYYELAIRKGMVPMAHAGLELALQGKVTLEELIESVVLPQDWIEQAESMRDFLTKAKTKYSLVILQDT